MKEISVDKLLSKARILIKSDDISEAAAIYKDRF
tara:strand:+ start:459 stop:560 length:102 start_codon:yes stop_codon:yes gene_type:complete